jgi:hypothetical protein
MRRWLRVAGEAAVLRSAIAAYLIVGTVLTLIFGAGELSAGAWSPGLAARSAPAFAIPFCVSLASAGRATCRGRARYGDPC